MARVPPRRTEYVLTLTCPEGPGIVFAVSRFVMEHGGNISASQQFDDRLTDRFFMRVQFRLDGADAEHSARSSPRSPASSRWRGRCTTCGRRRGRC